MGATPVLVRKKVRMRDYALHVFRSIVILFAWIAIVPEAAAGPDGYAYYSYDTKSKFHSYYINLIDGAFHNSSHDYSVSFKICPTEVDYYCFIHEDQSIVFSMPKKLSKDTKLKEWRFYGYTFTLTESHSLDYRSGEKLYLIVASRNQEIIKKEGAQFKELLGKDYQEQDHRYGEPRSLYVYSEKNGILSFHKCIVKDSVESCKQYHVLNDEGLLGENFLPRDAYNFFTVDQVELLKNIDASSFERVRKIWNVHQ